MKWLACFWMAVSLATAQSGALLSNQDALKLEQRAVQLMESTGLAVPGLAHAGAPALEDARQALANLQTAPQNAGNINAFVATARAYLAISDTLPKPYPFSEEGKRQFSELRDAVDRLDSHFRAVLDAKETQLRNPDRDNLKRYAEANEKLGAPATQRPRVVFLGDSITDGWRLKEYYGSDRDFVNRGIGGQVTGEMLGRMKADVIDLKPKSVLVLAGTNDLARGVDVKVIEDNLSMIADLAVAHHIEPMFASILPVSDYHKDTNPQFQQSSRRPPAKISELNNWLKAFCEQHHFRYVDYYSAMVDKDGFLQADASDDGLHPNAKGYRIMAPIALTAVDSIIAADVRPVKGKRAKPAPAEKPPLVTTTVAPPKEKVKAEEEKPAVSAAAAVTKEKAKPREEKPAASSTAAVPKEKAKTQEKAAVSSAAAAPKEKTKQEKPAPVAAVAPPKEKPPKVKVEKPHVTTAAAAPKPEKVKEEKPKDDKKTEEKPKEKKKSGIRAWLEKDHK